MSGLTDAGITVASCAELLFGSYRQRKKGLKKWPLNPSRRQKQLNERNSKLVQAWAGYTQHHDFTASYIFVFNQVCIHFTKRHSNVYVLMSYISTLNADKDELSNFRVLQLIQFKNLATQTKWQPNNLLSSGGHLVRCDKQTQCDRNLIKFLFFHLLGTSIRHVGWYPVEPTPCCSESLSTCFCSRWHSLYFSL